MSDQSAAEREAELLRAALAGANAKIRDARSEARRRVMEHATFDPATRTYYITELTLAHWGLI